MKNSRMILTVGAPASGKTTFATAFVKRNPKFFNINRDDFRAMLSDGGDLRNYKFSKAREELITKTQTVMVENIIKTGNNVIISDTNLNKKTRDYWEKVASDLRILDKVKYIPFYEPLPILLRRNMARDNVVPEKVVIDMYRKMREYRGEPTYSPIEGLPKAIIVDMDGTLAHMDGKRGAYEYEKAIDDRLDTYLDELVRLHVGVLGYKLIILTGRESDKSGVSEVTEAYLKKHNIPYDVLLCRKRNDARLDAVVKEEIFFDKIAANYDVKCVYDDRKQVVDMWRSIGLVCYQVADGYF